MTDEDDGVMTAEDDLEPTRRGGVEAAGSDDTRTADGSKPNDNDGERTAGSSQSAEDDLAEPARDESAACPEPAEGLEQGSTSEAAGADPYPYPDLDPDPEPEPEPEPGAASRPRSPYRQTAWAVARAVVVVAASVVVYQAVIPSTHVVPARLSRLVISEPGVTGFNTRPVNSAVEPASQTNLSALVTAAKQSPNQTGVYAIEWARAQTEGMAIFAYLLPNDARATDLLPEVRTQQLAAGSYTSDGLARRSTYTMASIPGATGSTYTASSKSAPTGSLAVAAFRSGRVVVVVEAETGTTTRATADTLASNEYTHLHRVESGFTLKVVHRPLVPTILWVIGTVILAALAAFGPIARRRLAERRRRRREEELSHLVIVGGRTITKHHR